MNKTDLQALYLSGTYCFMATDLQQFRVTFEEKNILFGRGSRKIVWKNVFFFFFFFFFFEKELQCVLIWSDYLRLRSKMEINSFSHFKHQFLSDNFPYVKKLINRKYPRQD